MKSKPRFRKGKKSSTIVSRTPRQEKMYRRYVAAMLQYHTERHAAIQSAMRIAFAAGATAMTVDKLARINSCMGYTQHNKTLALAQVYINHAVAISRSFEFTVQ
jgi:hypothetical protein